jgi:hypothetical protein
MSHPEFWAVTHVFSKSLIPIVLMTNPAIYRRERGDKAFGVSTPHVFQPN